MLKKVALGSLFLIFSYGLSAQNVQWASKVISASSELSPTQYSAKQLLKKPNVLPGGGENPNAWTPNLPNRKESLKVGFDNPMSITQIAIAESYNPTAVSEVYVYDGDDKEYLIVKLEPRKIPDTSRVLNIFTDLTPYEVHAVRVVLDGSAVEGYYSIDAIGISDSEIPVKPEINIARNINPGIKAERLSSNVNSPGKDLKPIISPDGKTMFFSRRNDPQNIGGIKDEEDIWYSEWDEEKQEWSQAKNIGTLLNNAGPNFISSITPDGNSMIVLLGNRYKSNGKMEAGVSVSTKTDEGWSKPQPLEIINDYNYSTKASYFMANNREVIIMSVERDDTNGARDLYVSFLQDDGKWSEPKNLGSTVNTSNEETGPFLASDDKTLYFSSNGFSGYGGEDIYITRRLDETWTNWTEPENLGSEINSPGDDVFFVIPPSGEYAYFSKQVGENDLDIFRLELPVFYKPAPVILVKGKVYNSKTNTPLEAKILYERLPEGVEVGMANSDPLTGKYEILIPSGHTYGYRADAENFISINANISLDSMTEYQELENDLYLVPVETGSSVALNNIFFDFDKSDLKQASFPELNRIVKLMSEKQNLKIEIRGHTDSVGTENYNKGLSEQRARSVYNYLVKQGIVPERLSYKGIGEEMPATSNETESGREKNRRVEFEIL